MRLWHQCLIDLLPRQQLLGQHRECTALKGKGWGRKHSVVNYVFNYPFNYLHQYHLIVMQEMENRGYKPDGVWKDPTYRGKILGFEESQFTSEAKVQSLDCIYPEHNDDYLEECLSNLRGKGVIIDYHARREQ